MEKRQHRRIPFRRTVYLTNHKGERQALQSSDFSLSGIALVSQQPAMVGEKVRLQFSVKTLGKSRELDVSGEVRHVLPGSDRYRVGINFLNQ